MPYEKASLTIGTNDNTLLEINRRIQLAAGIISEKNIRQIVILMNNDSGFNIIARLLSDLHVNKKNKTKSVRQFVRTLESP